MAAERKLKGEIDRTLKKVQEGQEVFEGLWVQVHDCDNSNQREKLEGELKKEIKKLQRLREQIKAWIAGADIKDKQPLMDTRKSIEKDMERFKVCEREMKMAGRAGVAKPTDPKEKAKDDAREWINNSVEALTAKVEESEYELEELGLGGGKKNRKPPPRVAELEEIVGRHKEHMGRLEKVLRCIDNETIHPDELEDLKSDMEMYLSGEGEEDGIDYSQVDVMYDELLDRLDALDQSALAASASAAGGKHGSKAKEDAERERERERENERQRAAAAAAKAQLIAQGNNNIRLAEEDEAASLRKPSAQAQSTKQQQQQHPQPAIPLVVPPPPPPPPPTATSRTTPTPSKDSAAAAAAPSGRQSAAEQRPQTGLEPQLAGAAGAAPGQGTPAADGQPHLQGVTGAAPHLLSGGGPPGLAGHFGPLGSDAHRGDTAAASGLGSSGRGPGGTNSNWLNATTIGGQGPIQPKGSQQAPNSAVSSMPGASAAPGHKAGAAASTAAGPASAAAAAGGGAKANGPFTMLMGRSGEAAAKADGPLTRAGSYGADGPASLDQQLASATRSLSLDTSGPQRDALLRAATGADAEAASMEPVTLPPAQPVFSTQAAKLVMESCYARACPHPSDTDWRRFRPRHPAAVPASYPRTPHEVVDNPALFRKVDPECLFFAFYFQPETYQQYMAAHELKRQSWRFHKHHNAWFQRFTEPSVTSEEYEQGAYVYFDYNIVHDDLQTGWCYRRKENFTFRYDALEDELRVS